MTLLERGIDQEVPNSGIFQILLDFIGFNLFKLGGKIDTGKFKLVGNLVKSTNVDQYDSPAKLSEFLANVSDIILEVGEDQHKHPALLQNGKPDVSDMSLQQYHAFESEKTHKKLADEQRLQDHSSGGKKRKACIIVKDSDEDEV